MTMYVNPKSSINQAQTINVISAIVPRVEQMDFVQHHSFFAMHTPLLNPLLVHHCQGEVVHLPLSIQRCMAETVHTAVGAGIDRLVGMTVGPAPDTGRGCCFVLYILSLQSLL